MFFGSGCANRLLVAVVLNVVPGLGAGYLYQRRWKAYWITSALATSWFVAGALLGQNADAYRSESSEPAGGADRPAGRSAAVGELREQLTLAG